MRLRVLAPCALRVRIRFRVVLYRECNAAIGVAFAQHRVDGATEYLRIARLNFPFGIVGRLFRVIRHVKALRLQLLDRSDELRNRGTDVRQLDDVCIGSLRQFAEFGQGVADTLLRGQVVREVGEDAACERDIAQLDVNAGCVGEGLDDRQERIRRQCRCFVGLRVDNLAHPSPFVFLCRKGRELYREAGRNACSNTSGNVSRYCFHRLRYLPDKSTIRAIR